MDGKGCQGRTGELNNPCRALVSLSLQFGKKSLSFPHPSDYGDVATASCTLSPQGPVSKAWAARRSHAGETSSHILFLSPSLINLARRTRVIFVYLVVC